MVGMKNFLVDVEVDCFTIMQILSLLHVNVCVHVCEDFGKYFLHQGIENLNVPTSCK